MRKLTFIILFASLVLGSCVYVNRKKINGNGVLTTETLNYSNFDKVKTHGFFDIYLETAGDFKVEIEGEENIIPYIETYVEDRTLHIRTTKNVSLNPHRDVKIYISAPDFRLVSNSGSGDINSSRQIQASDEIKFQINGSGDIDVAVDAPKVVSDVNGSGDVELHGNCRFFEGSVKGSGDIKAGDLKAEEVKISIAGSGNAEVFASIEMDITVRGSGNVEYRGDPKISQSVMGSGVIKKKN